MSEIPTIEIPTCVQAVFDEHADPTHASTRAIHDQLAPILAIVATVQKQLIEHRAVLDTAELTDHTQLLDGRLECMRQALGAAERELTALATSARQTGRALAQYDLDIEAAKTDVVNILVTAQREADRIANATTVLVSGTPVVIPAEPKP